MDKAASSPDTRAMASASKIVLREVKRPLNSNKGNKQSLSEKIQKLKPNFSPLNDPSVKTNKSPGTNNCLQTTSPGRNTLRALTAEEKQRETQVPGHLLPVVGKALRWGKSGVSTPCRPPASHPDHPPRPRIADCTLYIGLLSAKKTTMRASQS